MEKVKFPLHLRFRRPEVADLHEALTVLGYAIGEAELTSHRYGKSTQNAVTQFQRAHSLPAIGHVDEATANVINSVLEEYGGHEPGSGSDLSISDLTTDERHYMVRGKVVSDTTLKGIADLRLEAWGKVGTANKKLASTTTDDAGGFRIQFDLEVSDQNSDPQGVLRIYSGKKLVLTTTEQPISNWVAEADAVIIKVDLPVPSSHTMRIYVSLRYTNGQAAAGVQLMFSYSLSSGEPWTSQPNIADAEGKLSFDVPVGKDTAIDWSRVDYAFSLDDTPLQVAGKTIPQQAPDGMVIAFTLKQATIPWPQDPNKWYVRGRVMTATGDAVLAHVSAEAISLNAIQSLGRQTTGESGRYEIMYEWDGRCAPDVRVRATVGETRIAQSAIYFAVGKSVRIDLIQDNESYLGPTEFQRVEARVLHCNDDFHISDIGEKQFEYLLGKTRLGEDKLSFYLVARKLQSLSDVPAAVFYGLFRAKMPATLQGLVLQPPKVLRNALNKSIQKNIIDRKYAKAFDSLLAALRQMAVAGSITHPQPLDHAGVGDVLTMAEVPSSAQEPLLTLYLQHQGDDASFWEALSQDAQLSVHASTVKTALQTGALAGYHLPTMQAFKTRLGADGTINDLAQWQDSDWQAFVESLQLVPDGIPGDALPERIRFHVDNMSRTVKRAFAREYTTANVLRSDTFADPLLRQFLTTIPDYDYSNSSIPAALDQAQLTGEARISLETTLKGLRRLYRIGPLEHKFPVLEALYAGGVTSSKAITVQGQTLFIDQYAPALGGVDIAAQVYNQAATVTAVSTNLLTSFSDLFNASSVYAIGGGVPISQPDKQGDLVLPSYQDLFGSQSFCECVHCSSVYSPAAYFVDLLEYLRQSPVTKKIGGTEKVTIVINGDPVNKTGRDVLFARRPDLGEIRLDCKNTNTVLPYIDLINEIFERAVVGETDSSPNQTTWIEQELKANPEHVLNGAYDTLAETVYPLSLPFRLWNVEAELYLQHLGVSRWQLMQTMAGLPGAGSAEFEKASFEYLGLTTKDVEIITGAPEYSGNLEAVRQMWGYDSNGWRSVLLRVPEFLKRSGLTYSELLQLVNVPYLQADGEFGIDFSDAESACDIDGAVLRYLATDPADGFDTRLLSKKTLDRIQRFLRLRRKTGWSIWELSRVLAALPEPQITVTTLVQVSVLKRLLDGLALEVLEGTSWWADMDTALDETNPDYRSWYEIVFLNPAVLNPPDEALVLANLGSGALISEHFSSIAAALQISESDATLLAASLLDSQGAIDDALTLANLSVMYRIASLCRALNIDITQYLLLARLIDASPWTATQPQNAIRFVSATQFQQGSGWTSAELGYLLLHDAASVGSVQISSLSIAELLTAIQIAVRAVWAGYVLSSSPVIEQLKARLGDYVEQETVNGIVAIVGQNEPYSTKDRAYLKDTLHFLEPIDLEQAAEQTLPADIRYRNLLLLLNLYGRTSGSVNVVAQIIANAFALDLAVAQQLLIKVIARTDQPGEFALHALLDPLFIDSGKEKLAAAMTADVMLEAFRIVEGSSSLPEADIKAFIKRHFVFLDRKDAKRMLFGAAALTDVLERYQYVTAPLDDAQYLMSEEVFAEQFAAIRNIQKSALVVGKFQITETELPLLNRHADRLQVLPVTGYPFAEQPDNFAGFEAWRRLAQLVSLRRVFVATDSQLFVQLGKVLYPNLIDIVSVNEEVAALIDGGLWQETDQALLVWLSELASATGWSFSDVVYVAAAKLLAASLIDFLNVGTLVYVTDVIELAVRLGTTAAQLDAWSALDVTQADAANAKQTARARYTLEQWYGIAPTLRDVLREAQRDALTANMLHQGGFGATSELYNHYLIDSEMSACMLTSRVKLALNSVQLFLQRCLLNLEDEFVAVQFPEEWEWRKNYRVWEANRKVFLYPENYIKPELRITRSEIFDAAQSVLLQNEVTQDVAERALLRYLEELDGVSNLEVVGSYHEKEFSSTVLANALQVDDGTIISASRRHDKGQLALLEGRSMLVNHLPLLNVTVDRLHVVARTRGIPHKYYYRVRDGLAWSPWQEVDADISADQVMPVVIDSRLYLFWPVFFEKQIAGVDVLSNSAIKEAKDAKISEENDYDAYLTYLLNYVFIDTTGSEASYSDFFSSMEEVADGFNLTLDQVIEAHVAAGAETWDEYLVSAREALDGTFEETINFFEIKLSVSEYKNGNWMPSRISEHYIESDQKISALALLEENQLPATPGDFHFYTTVADDIVTIECLQTFRYTDGNDSSPYVEGDFEYNILSKEILAFDHKDDYRGSWIEAPTGADVIANQFVENEERIFEIPLVTGDLHFTTYLTLLEKTPGTFRAPIQHQYEQFSSSHAFFFGDDKRSFIVSPDTISSFEVHYADSILLDGYLNSDIPGIGAYNTFVINYTNEVDLLFSSASVERSISAAKTRSPNKMLSISAPIDGLLDTSVSEFYPPMRDVYRFESFYHPLVGELINQVNGDGAAAALSRETQRISEKYFIGAYQPTDDVADEYPIRDFSFHDLDANGFYNYEFFFHVPLLIAVRLSQNQQFADAQKWFHTIFDPTSRSSDKGAQRFWQFKPFFDMYDNTAGHPFDSIYDMLSALAAGSDTTDGATLALQRQTEEQIAVWRANPFDPHAIAALRPVAYMKTVVMEYLNNLIAWGDYLYAQFTIESINEATLYYMLAYQILGDRPVALPELQVVAKSYNELGEVDAFSNAVAELETLINLPEASSSAATPPPPPLYFCIPNNPTLVQYWDTVEDRLFKIRHCMTIEGVVQQLALFEPPIDPALLVLARASGVSISAALASLATPAPHYRFVYLMQKAVEYCHVVKSLGSQLLAAYEKQDAEDLSLIRAGHEESLLNAATELRNLQVDEARENLAAMEKSKLLVEERIDYYSDVEQRSEKENSAIKSLDNSERQRVIAGNLSVAASIAAAVPNFTFTFSTETGATLPKIVVGQDIQFGGSNIAAVLNSVSGGHANASAKYATESNKIATDAGYDRRWDDWKHQERLAEKELAQIEKQIIAAQIRLALAEKERDNHAIQVQQSREVKDFLTGKFSNQELYGWMISQTSAIYFQSYKLAYDLAKRCEKAYQRESGEYSGTYIDYGYFDSLKKGLLSGERLHHDLQRMEFDFLNNNRREYELTKHASLLQLNPSALIELRETGVCFISLPEMLFDGDYPGHYFRRIKSVSLTIPCITGPYTTLSSTLTLQSDKVRIVAKKDEGDTDLDNMQFNLAAVKSIATSSCQSDSGVFQLDYRDERYLPFEGAGVISEWKLELNDPLLAQFDYNTISDVVLHINYTARDGGEIFRTSVETKLRELIDDYFTTGQPLQQLISLKQSQGRDWAQLSNLPGDAEYQMTVDMGLCNFPFYLRNRGIQITSIMLALTGTNDISNGDWGSAELPGVADEPVGFALNSDFGLPSVEFQVEISVGDENESVQVVLPYQVISAINEEINDIYVICSYQINPT